MGETTSQMNFLKYCRKKGIKRDFINSYSSQHNGVAERKNRTIVEMARRMLKTKYIRNEFWSEEVNTTFYTLNRCPTREILNLNPEEAWPGYKPSVAQLKVCGCTAYAHVPKEKRSKLDDKSVNIFIGYSIETRSSRLFDPQVKKVIISRNVVFDEQGIYQPKNVQIKLRKNGVDKGDGSNYRTTKIDEFKKNPKCLERGHSKSNTLDINFERKLTRSQICLVNYALMDHAMKMDEPHTYADA
jgi:hypothetical protein